MFHATGKYGLGRLSRHLRTVSEVSNYHSIRSNALLSGKIRSLEKSGICSESQRCKTLITQVTVNRENESEVTFLGTGAPMLFKTMTRSFRRIELDTSIYSQEDRLAEFNQSAFPFFSLSRAMSWKRSLSSYPSGSFKDDHGVIKWMKRRATFWNHRKQLRTSEEKLHRPIGFSSWSLWSVMLYEGIIWMSRSLPCSVGYAFASNMLDDWSEQPELITTKKKDLNIFSSSSMHSYRTGEVKTQYHHYALLEYWSLEGEAKYLIQLINVKWRSPDRSKHS